MSESLSGRMTSLPVNTAGAGAVMNTAVSSAGAYQVKVMKRVAAPMMHQIKKKKVAAYCRVSTDLVQQATSLETQMKTFNNMIKEHPDWQLAGIYAEAGSSQRRDRLQPL